MVDRKGLVHTGYLFSAANFAAMASVNEGNVVLASAKTNFLAAMALGDEAVFEAQAMQTTTRKRNVLVIGKLGNVKIFEGEFATVVLDRHVLSLHLT